MPHPTKNNWTPEQVEKLKRLFESGATLLRAAAALNHTSTMVQKKARELGFAFTGVRKCAPICGPAASSTTVGV
jgi:hypothetical protein